MMRKRKVSRMSRAIDADALMESSMYEFWQDGSAITPIGEYILSKFRNLIRSMPTIEPERKKGKWILDNSRLRGNRYTCDQCGYETDTSWNPPGHFCPNCGADMRGEE